MSEKTMEQVIKEGRERREKMEAHLDDIRIHRGKGPKGIEGIVEDVVLFFTNRTNRDAGLYQIPAKMFEPFEDVKKYSEEERELQLEMDDLVSAVYDDYLAYATRETPDIEGVTCVLIGGVKMDYRELPDSIILTPKVYATQIANRVRRLIGDSFARKSVEEKQEIAEGSPFVSYDVLIDKEGKLSVDPVSIPMPGLEGKRVYESMEAFLSEDEGNCDCGCDDYCGE